MLGTRYWTPVKELAWTVFADNVIYGEYLLSLWENRCWYLWLGVWQCLPNHPPFTLTLGWVFSESLRAETLRTCSTVTAGGSSMFHTAHRSASGRENSESLCLDTSRTPNGMFSLADPAVCPFALVNLSHEHSQVVWVLPASLLNVWEVAGRPEEYPTSCGPSTSWSILPVTSPRST